jgi:hypothetical protein
MSSVVVVDLDEVQSLEIGGAVFDEPDRARVALTTLGKDSWGGHVTQWINLGRGQRNEVSIRIYKEAKKIANVSA